MLACWIVVFGASLVTARSRIARSWPAAGSRLGGSRTLGGEALLQQEGRARAAEGAG